MELLVLNIIMEKRAPKVKRRCIINFIVLVLSLLVVQNVLAYDKDFVHPLLTAKVINISSLDEYLENNLGFNTYQRFSGKSIRCWLRYGSSVEDSITFWRPINHFYDPISGEGLTDMLNGVPALLWATEHTDNQYSYSAAREYYRLALTSSTEQTRDKYFALTFRSLGQVIHVLQDMSVPAHVRNDAHPDYKGHDILGEKDHYEAYCKEHYGTLSYTSVLVRNSLNLLTASSGESKQFSLSIS